ncbi:MAG: putative zinc-binding metallopeptidase [Planctomycetaceae bacterium]|nr:putative zinc-binding metallopeptidase [Planctomycetaceae bacterium]
MTSNSRSRHSSNGKFDLDRLTDEELLDIRICDLGVKIEGTVLEERIEELYEELDSRGFNFRPHFWLSDGWYTPDGVPGVAIPFYLAHPRLIRLERRLMLEAEGATETQCMRILRHETGHAIDNAYRLRRRRRYRDVFGRVSQPYRSYYEPRPYSKKFVLHFDMWYAQAHPVEDFAETFAVWLRPRSRWRKQYEGWPALKKLQFVHDLMQEVREKKPVVVSRQHVDTVRQLKQTLRQHYEKKRDFYGLNHPGFYDRDIRRLFSDADEHRDNPTAASYLKRVRRSLRETVARWTGEYQYTIDQVLKEIISHCREHRLRLRSDEEDTTRELLVLLTIQTMNYLHGGRHRIAL